MKLGGGLNLILNLMRIALVAAIGAAQAQTSAPPSRPEFEVASIKPNNGVDERPGMQVSYGGHVTIHAMTVRILIGAAYNIDESFQVSGGPRWTETERYDIVAQAPRNAPAASFEWWKPMLQSLLEDRFRLGFHRETKQLPVYELAAAKNGIKIAPLKEGACVVADPQKPRQVALGEPAPRFCNNLRYTRGGIEAIGVDMTRLANTLAAILKRTVVDKTGFHGIFDLHLEYAPVEDTPDTVRPSIFTALQEQLGLRLQSAKGPVEVLVVDHVERPSDN
jgi:uncharacterized protein (TIGR03435 family)